MTIRSDAATFTISNVFGSNMVLQRNALAPIWGFAGSNTAINILFDGKNYSTVAGDDGAWVWSTPSYPATSTHIGYDIVFSTSDGASQTLSNVLFGDVYLCSGQSNMVFAVNQAFNASAEIAAANDPFYSGIRVMTVAHKNATEPMQQLAGIEQAWSVANSQSIGNNGNQDPWGVFSATCWFTGKNVYDSLNGTVPLGLIVSAVSATPIQLWSPPEAAAECPGYPAPTTTCDALNGCLWNAMVAPMHYLPEYPLALSGFLWYQGEQNIGNADKGVNGTNSYYACALPAMVEAWRARFKLPTGFFGFVLLAPWVVGGGNLTALPKTRLAMVNASYSIVNSGMAPAYDLGDTSTPWPGHPRDKEDVGKRMAASVLALVYGQTGMAHRGPAYQSASAINGVEGTITVTVTFANDTLLSCDGAPGPLVLNTSITCPTNASNTTVLPVECEAFAVMTNDGVWRQAGPGDVSLTPDGTAVIIRIQGVPAGTIATYTRGMYANWPLAWLYNGCGWPVVPWLELISG